MKPLIVTNHSLQQYAARTGRDSRSCVAELINSIRIGECVNADEANEQGFKILRRFKGDKYYIWYDPKIDDKLLAIVASDGAIKTVFRSEMWSYCNNKGAKVKYERGDTFDYDRESKRKTNSSRRWHHRRVRDNKKRNK